MKVKICGITRIEDAKLATQLGAWALGFIFYKKSPRYFAPEAAAEIIAALPKEIRTVGVFVNSSREAIEEAAETSGISVVQLHGDESPEFCAGMKLEVIKAVRPRAASDVAALADYSAVHKFLIDAAVDGQYGGTGSKSDWSLAREAKAYGSVILSGGLNAENVAQAVGAVEPMAVDVSSGVESKPGVKDPARMEKFFEVIRSLK